MKINTAKMPLKRIAQKFNLGLVGQESLLITGVCSFWKSKSESLCFFNLGVEDFRKNQEQLAENTIVIIPKAFAIENLREDVNFLLTENPRLSFAEVMEVLGGDVNHNISSVDSHVWKNLVGAEGTYISQYAIVEEGSTIGQKCVIHAGVFVSRFCEISDEVEILPNTVLGVDGVSHVTKDNNEFLHIAQYGRVLIGRKTKIGANSVICRGAVDPTIIGRGCSIGHRVGIGHNCNIASNVFIGAGSTVSGSVSINENAWIGPGSSILNKIKVGKNATVGLGSVVTQNVAINTAVFGCPARAQKHSTFHKNRRPSNN